MNDDDQVELVAAANELLEHLYKEYPEKLPFYCRDAAERLDAVVRKVTGEPS